jgi:hypothetical protein
VRSTFFFFSVPQAAADKVKIKKKTRISLQVVFVQVELQKPNFYLCFGACTATETLHISAKEIPSKPLK